MPWPSAVATGASRLPSDLNRFYRGLLASESRHFENYLALARSETDFSDSAIDRRLDELLDLEAALITEHDTQFRFHSGRPAAAEESVPTTPRT